MPLRSAAGRSDSTAAAVTSFKSRADSSRACPAFSCSMRLTSISVPTMSMTRSQLSTMIFITSVSTAPPAGGRADEELRVPLDHGQRGPELVAHVAQVLPPHPVQLLELAVGLDDAGQVGARLLEQPGVLQRDRGLAGKGLHELLVLGSEAAHVLGEHLEGAEGLRPAPQGDPEEGAVAEALDHLGEEQARLLLHVQRRHRPPLLEHHPGQAVAQPEPLPRLDHLLLEPLLGRDLEGIPGAQQQDAMRGPHHPVDGARHQRKEVLDVQPLDHPAPDLHQRLHLLAAAPHVRDQPRVVEGDGDVPGHRLHHREVEGGKGDRPQPPQVQRSDDAVPGEQRHHGHGPHGLVGDQVPVPGRGGLRVAFAPGARAAGTPTPRGRA